MDLIRHATAPACAIAMALSLPAAARTALVRRIPPANAQERKARALRWCSQE